MGTHHDLTGQSVVVTGGASGLGRAVAVAALAAGAKVTAVDRNPAGLEALCRELPGMLVQTGDVGDPEAAAGLVERAWTSMEGITCLVNAAGTIANEVLLNLLSRGDKKHSLAGWQNTLHSNLTTTFVMTTATAEKLVMARRQGVIVNISSVCARGNPGQAAYSAAKAGVNAFTRVAAAELGPLGVRVAAVAPGFMDTPSTRAALSEKSLEGIKREIPLRRLGQAQHVVQAVFSILENDYMNGCVLAVDAGL